MVASDMSRVLRLTDPRVLPRRVLTSLSAVAFTFGAAACSTAPSPPTNTPQPGPVHVGTVAQSPTECTLDAITGPIPAGPIVLSATNETDDFVVFDMWRIVGNRTYEEFAAYIQADRELAEAGEAGLDHPGYVANYIGIELQAGESGALEGTVVPGTYAIVCIRMFPQVGEPRPFALVGPLEVH